MEKQHQRNPLQSEKLLKMKYFLALSIFVITLFSSCSSSQSSTKPITQADKILSKSIKAHGGKKYDKAHYEFVFRKKKYTFKNEGQKYEYTASSEKNGASVKVILNNEGISRIIDGKKMPLTPKEVRGLTGGLNSVIYFATLPHKLLDPAVNKTYKGTTSIKGQSYEVLHIYFNEENGGVDHDDNFYYWINAKTNRIDYLAYDYKVNSGGVRFRSAYNTRVVDGILFQDYVNYKAPVGTALSDLPALFEKGELKKLSVIETENVINLK